MPKIIINVETLYDRYKWVDRPQGNTPIPLLIFIDEILHDYEVIIYHSKSANIFQRIKMKRWFARELKSFIEDLQYSTNITGSLILAEEVGLVSIWDSRDAEAWVNFIINKIKWPWFMPNLFDPQVLGQIMPRDTIEEYPTMNDLKLKYWELRHRNIENYIPDTRRTLRDVIESSRTTDLDLVDEDADGY